MTNVYPRIVKWGFFGVKNNGRFTYSEGSNRMSSIGTKPGTLPVTCDCSAFVTLCYFWAGCKDPNGLGYNHEGYTGTLINHGREINAIDVKPGDLVIYGPGTGEHVALVISEGHGDPVTISMGKQGDPSVVRVSQDGRPYRFYRYDTTGPGVIKRALNHLPRPRKVVVAQSPITSVQATTAAMEQATAKPPAGA